ncbi:unnamed protein product [Hydatigera taeniaeformis]|uniref:Protein HGH1 homolog n=1 Tax=Hydatigena taeniaeformis TaxID=6205 RepID=A0A0R3WI10_HYDTA|nr:unnamed protein product [Hydatigera taeniaeformis]
MQRAELLESLLEVSTNEECTCQLKNELGQYFNLMVGVILESANLLPPQALGTSTFNQCIFSLGQTVSPIRQLLLNLTSVRSMRQRICDGQIHLSLLVSLLPELQDTASRLTIAGILKNCCFEEEYHGRLCYHSDDMIVSALIVLCDANDVIKDEDLCKLPPPIREVYHSRSAKRESDVLVKTTICEALLQLCATKTGRQYLRSLGLYFILREMHRFECDEENILKTTKQGKELLTQKNLVFVVEHVVDQLICEENERPKDYSSLRDVPIDKETEEKLDKAKSAYFNST